MSFLTSNSGYCDESAQTCANPLIAAYIVFIQTQVSGKLSVEATMTTCPCWDLPPQREGNFKITIRYRELCEGITFRVEYLLNERYQRYVSVYTPLITLVDLCNRQVSRVTFIYVYATRFSLYVVAYVHASDISMKMFHYIKCILLLFFTNQFQE